MAVSTDESAGSAEQASSGLTASGVLATAAYRVVGYFGLMSVIASLAWGFRHSAAASWWNVGLDVFLYGLFIAPHLLLTQREVKQAVFGRLAGTLRERQLYILFTIGTWLVVLWLHWPVPGPELALWEPVRFAGLVGFLWAVLLFFEGATREQLDGLLGVPGTQMQYSHGSETPLRTDGQYAQVRHPMYRAVMLMGVAALVYHPNAGQLLWTVMLGLSFVLFIPLEEKQLLAARGDEYRRYCERTPWRVFRGVW
jgi:protein-S-isoprenylcysteine O-methyltransferase Ste14